MLNMLEYVYSKLLTKKLKLVGHSGLTWYPSSAFYGGPVLKPL